MSLKNFLAVSDVYSGGKQIYVFPYRNALEIVYFLTSSLSETQKQSYLIFNKIQYLKGDLG